MHNEAIDALEKWLRGRVYAFHEKPLSADASQLTYWTKSNKHKSVTPLDLEFLRAYVSFSLAAGRPFLARGIEVPGRGFVQPDVARMNSLLNANFVALKDGLFTLTVTGLRHLGLGPVE